MAVSLESPARQGQVGADGDDAGVPLGILAPAGRDAPVTAMVLARAGSSIGDRPTRSPASRPSRASPTMRTFATVVGTSPSRYRAVLAAQAGVRR